MFTGFEIFGFTVYMYGLLITIGAAVGTLIVVFRKNYRSIQKTDIFYSLCYALVGVLIGSKLLFVLVSLGDIITYINSDYFSFRDLTSFIGSGFVFYGGLLGGILGLYIYTKRFKLSFIDMLDTVIVGVPLVHAFGRIGCFCAGCCYGIPFHQPIGMIFKDSPFAPKVPLLPIQLYEACFNILIFIILLLYSRKLNTSGHKESNKLKESKGKMMTKGPNSPGRITALYLILYSIGRFVLEFFRYDEMRGILFSLSTSQYISILLFIIGMIIWIDPSKIHKRRR